MKILIDFHLSDFLYNYGAFRNITDSLKELADILKAFMNEK